MPSYALWVRLSWLRLKKHFTKKSGLISRAGGNWDFQPPYIQQLREEPVWGRGGPNLIGIRLVMEIIIYNVCGHGKLIYSREVQYHYSKNGEILDSEDRAQSWTNSIYPYPKSSTSSWRGLRPEAKSHCAVHPLLQNIRDWSIVCFLLLSGKLWEKNRIHQKSNVSLAGFSRKVTHLLVGRIQLAVSEQRCRSWCQKESVLGGII